MNTDTRKRVLVVLLILLIVSLALGLANLWLNFLPAGTTLIGIITAVLSFVTLIAGTPDKIKSWLEWLTPTPETKDEKTNRLLELRALTNSLTPEQAHNYTEKILGQAQNQIFWAEISRNTRNTETMARLVTNPFLLAGLLDVFEQHTQQLPQNIGALLDALLGVLWQKNKLGRKPWVGLEDAQAGFARLARSCYPSNEYPTGNYSWQMIGPLRAYREMLNVLGAKRTARPPDWLYGIGMKYASWNSYYWEDTINWIEKQPRPLRLILTLFLSAFYSLFNFFVGLPQHVVDGLGFRKRRALALLELAERAHLLQRDEYSFSFTPPAWGVYFAALDNRNSDFETIIQRSNAGWHTDYWNRLRPEDDIGTIALCGLLPNPDKFIEKLMPIDPYLAAQCILSGVENLPENLRAEAYKQLINRMKDVQDAGEIRSLESARFLRELRDDPSAVEEIIETIENNYVEFVNAELARLMAGYGVNVFELLVKHLETARHSKRFILLALGFLGDSRAIPVLKSMLSGQDGLIRMTALMVLVTCFHDPDASQNWESHLLFRENYEDGKTLWHVADDCLGAAVIPLLFQVFQHSASLPEDPLIGRERWGDADERFLSMLERNYQKNSQVDEALLARLAQSPDVEFQHLILRALGAIQSEKAVDILLENLSSQEEDLQIAAINALGKINAPQAVAALIGKLYSQNAFVVAAAVRVLGEIRAAEAVPALLKKLKSNEVARSVEIPTDYGYPIDFLSMQALVEIKTAESLDAATDWCRAHLGDTRKLNWGHRGDTIAEECLNYLEYMIQTDRAHAYWREWHEQHDK
jgi:HEAT repeat protein